MARSFHNGVFSNFNKVASDHWPEPKYWRRLEKHKKRRSAMRELKHKILTEKVDLDNVAYPLDSKPWVYFW